MEQTQIEIVHYELPKYCSYQTGRDFVIEFDGVWYKWFGKGRSEGDYCGWEAYRTIEKAVADAIFRLAIADGKEVLEALLVVPMNLPTDHLDLDDIDYAL